ncbi:MAG: DUF4139 domain-containing protein [Acidobacteria bacterium]|nr:DUF4139 domain-containing protein [Acidobacteriota bacterium]
MLNKIAALTLIFVMVAGTTFTASASDETRREGAKKSENKETGQPGQSAQAGQTGTSTIENQEKVAITVYNSNIGLVKDTRTLRLPRGASQLRFMDVSQQINPVTVHIKSITAPNAMNIIEQSYEYDLLNPQKLLDKYVGQELTLVLRRIENNTERLVPTRATLLSNNAGQVWQIEGQIVINPTNIAEIRFDKLPQDLIAKPTLVWTLNNTGPETHTVEASYLTQGLNWRADYVVVVNQNDTKADLNGWVTLTNNSGTAYRNAELKLVAGDVNRVTDQVQMAKSMRAMELAAAAPQPQFQEQSFFEYHLYTLQRTTTVKNNETKQINLLSAANFNVKKELVLNGQQYYYQGYNNPGEPIKEKVGVYIEFKNSKENDLGQPLPAGVIRVYKADQSGSQQFIGENRIDHTPKDESVRVKLGDAFDVVAERKQTDYKTIARRVFEYAYEIRIRNHKDEAVTVVVNEPIGGDWRLSTRHFPQKRQPPLPPDSMSPLPKTAKPYFHTGSGLKCNDWKN